MAQTFPYFFYACSCSENIQDPSNAEEHEPEFDPSDPLSAYSLSTLDHLLFCDECNQIRCERCLGEEVLNWYCPNCLFETHTTGVRADGNRCSRSCYNCPICTSPVIVGRHQINQDSDASAEEYILLCQYCDWTSLEIGVRFDKSNKITEQLNQIRKTEQTSGSSEKSRPWSQDEHFSKLSDFYRDQLTDANELPGRTASGAYGTPSNLARIIHMYGGNSHKALNKAQERPRSMREATKEEGLASYTGEDDEADLIRQLESFQNTASITQQNLTPMNADTRMAQALWPAATNLRTRRGKRCRQCRQFVVRPETKTTALRYKIRILARAHIPRLDIRPLNASKPAQHPDFVLRNELVEAPAVLQPFQTYQYILTLRNPIFETVKITLATPGTIPGLSAFKVTILCPSFVMGPAGDVWEDALSGSTASAALGDGSRKAAMASLTGGVEGDKQPEAGKVWEQTRNTTSVVLEVVTGTVDTATTDTSGSHVASTGSALEIPISVRAEWAAEGVDERGQKSKAEPKELQYWCVLGIGRIAGL